MKYRTWKKNYYIKHKDGSRGCIWYLPEMEEIIGISKFLHWFRHHRNKIKWWLIKHWIRTYPERRKCHICGRKLRRKERIVFHNDGLHCSLCNDCNNSDWSI